MRVHYTVEEEEGVCGYTASRRSRVRGFRGDTTQVEPKSGGVSVPAVELGGRVAEVALHVDELLQLVKLPVHLQHGHLLAVERVGAVEELDARG